MISRIQAAEIAAQIGSALLPDNTQWTNRFTVNSSSSSAIYVVAQRRSDGVWGCSCRGWTHYRHCKHTTDILRRLTAVAEKPQQFDADTAEMLRSAQRQLDLDIKPREIDTSRHVRVRKLQLD